MARRRSSKRAALVLTPGLLLILLVGCLAVWLERADRLPEPAAAIVREAEAAILAPVFKELGIELPRTTQTPVVPDGNIDIGEARTLLGRVRVEAELREGYERSDWPHWLDLDHDCRNRREKVLMAESLEPPLMSRDGCRVLKGRWRDLYTGETVSDPAGLDIDHVVALEEAHGSGGHAWDCERRAAFANDLTDARSLIAVTAAANRAKGAQGPEDWLPPDQGDRCRYVVD